MKSKAVQLLNLGLILLSLTANLQGQIQEVSADLDSFRVMYSDAIFSEVDIRDARVAIELWTMELSKQLDIPLIPKTTIVTEMNTLIDAVLKGEVDMVAIQSIDYLRIRNRLELDPALIGIKGESYQEELVILVHQESRIRVLEDLKGLSISTPIGPGRNTIMHLWLETLLDRSFGIGIDSFFTELKHVMKPSQSILSVFFRQADACIVTRRSFDVMVELNPQVGRNLHVVVSSRGFVRYLFCFRKGCDARLRDTVTEAALSLESMTKGKQILTLFKLDRVIEYQPYHMENVIQLLDEHLSLKRGRGRPD